MNYFILILFSILSSITNLNSNEINGQNKEAFQLKSAKKFVNVQTLGIAGDSITDVSDKLQVVLSKYDSIFMPNGNYIISKSLYLKSDQVIYGSTNTNIFERAVVSKDFDFLIAKSQENITVRLINFKTTSNSDKASCAIKIINCKNVSAFKINSYNCSILISKVLDEVQRYKEIRSYIKNNLQAGSTAIRIDNCKGSGVEKGISKRSFGVSLEYVTNWSVTNTSVKNYQHGIQWWGGDSNPEKDGDTTNKRKCTDGKILNVTVENIGAGGIWGSMGENILVENCKVSNCGDVGIDFEGCFNSRAKNNKVINCNNGCIATFYFNKNILFESNIINQATASKPLSCIYNSSQSQHNGLVQYVNNTFSVDNGVGFINQQGPSNNIVFERNKLFNVVINLKFNNNRLLTIKNNSIKISRPVKDYNFIIKAGETNNNGVLTIDGNKIVSTVKQPNTVSAIYAYQADYNSSPITRITNNTITGIDRKFKIEWQGTNAGVTSKTYIKTSTAITEKDVEIIDNTKRSEVTVNNKKFQ